MLGPVHKKTSGGKPPEVPESTLDLSLMTSVQLHLAQTYRFEFDVSIRRCMLLEIFDDFENVVVDSLRV